MTNNIYKHQSEVCLYKTDRRFCRTKQSSKALQDAVRAYNRASRRIAKQEVKQYVPLS